MASKRVYAGLGILLAALMTGPIAWDIYLDWQVQGNPLWLTLAENAFPLSLGAVLFGTIYWVYQNRDRKYVVKTTRWQFFGSGGVLFLVGSVIALQIIQGQIKPYLVVLQATLGGAVGGILIGYATADLEDTRAAMERERDRFEALFENAPAEAADCRLSDGDPVINRANQQFTDVFGDAVGRPLFDVINHDEATAAELRKSMQASEPLEAVVEAVSTADGDRTFQLRVVPYGDGQAYVLYTDITDLRETQRELEETVARVEASNERLQQFAYVASHDLQEPLRMVSSYVDLLASEYEDELDDEADEYIEFAVDGAERMQDMIDGLLEYSRVRSQGEEFAEVDTEAVFEEVRQDLKLLVEEADAEVTTGDLPAVEADRGQLGQLFRNLVENAIDHGGTEVHVSGERRNGAVVFSVADNGPGIPQDQQDDIFELFEQRDRDDDGTGMGLAICERILSRHDGEIWVESEDGEGATFRFSIPD